ncbi:MAG: polysaccharide biosynthesis/export family protein [Pseudomonadota bacterium]
MRLVASLSAFTRTAVLLIAACAGLAACTTNASAPIAEFSQLGLDDRGPPPLAPGDRVKIVVFDERDLSGTFPVSASGTVAVPLVGDIRATGLTVAQFRKRLNAKLRAGYLTNPRTNVEIVNYRPVLVHGEVRSGGEIKYRVGMTFRDAIATAGGYSYRAEERYVLLVRRGIREPVRVEMPNTSVVHPGDNIRVPERFF